MVSSVGLCVRANLRLISHGLLSGLICIATLVKFEQLFKLLNVIILVTDDLVEVFDVDVTFLMFRQLVVVDMLFCDPETPELVT